MVQGGLIMGKLTSKMAPISRIRLEVWLSSYHEAGIQSCSRA